MFSTVCIRNFLILYNSRVKVKLKTIQTIVRRRTSYITSTILYWLMTLDACRYTYRDTSSECMFRQAARFRAYKYTTKNN